MMGLLVSDAPIDLTAADGDRDSRAAVAVTYLP
jgi:hypothetical protein